MVVMGPFINLEPDELGNEMASLMELAVRILGTTTDGVTHHF